METPTAKTSAAYGHACSNCVKAKCKCIPRQNGSCERCHRLSKDCQPASFVRKKGQRKLARQSHLEDKLDNIVTLLQAQHVPTPSVTPSPHGQTASSEQAPSSLREPGVLPYHGLPKGFPSDQGPREVLATFRTRYLEYFPFIDIPTANDSIDAFVHERPSTYKAIQVIYEKSRLRQKENGTRVREELVLRVVHGGERSIDLLLCLLVCITWQVYFEPKRRGGMGMFLNVAKHVIADLGYNRPTGLVMVCPRPPVIVGQLPDQHEAHNDEERRALVACFALSAMTALSIKTEPMRWSSRIAEACDRLSQNVENKADATLVALARISRVSVEASNTLQQVQDEPTSASHALHQVRALRTMLDIAKSNLTQEQQQNKLVVCYFHSVEVQIYDPALYDLSPSLSNPTLDYQRIECLTACLLACKASLDNYLIMPAISMNMVTVLAFSYAAQVLYTISVIEIPGWDRGAARVTADVLWYFDQLAVNLEGACRQLQQETGEPENVFTLAGGYEGLKSLRVKWRESLETATGVGLAAGAGGSFVVDFRGAGDTWMTNADLWFTNMFGDTPF